MVIREWKSDTFQNTGLEFDVTLYIYDSAGTELAVNRLNGQENLSGAGWSGPARAKDGIPVAYRRKLEALFASAAVAKSLR